MLLSSVQLQGCEKPSTAALTLNSFNHIPQDFLPDNPRFFSSLSQAWAYVMCFTRCQKGTFVKGSNLPEVQQVSGCFVLRAANNTLTLSFFVVFFIRNSLLCKHFLTLGSAKKIKSDIYSLNTWNCKNSFSAHDSTFTLSTSL